MSTLAPPRSSTLQRYPIATHDRPEAVAAYRRGAPVTAAQFLAEVARIAQALPDSGHVLNLCTDRYRFATLLCAAIVRGQVTLLPPATTPNVIREMRRFAPDAYFVADDPETKVDLARFELPAGASEALHSFAAPQIAAEQVAACVFTSGSTGEPQPHFKRWGDLVLDVGEEARRLQVGVGHAVLGTVPPQHMYGLESTVLLPLLSGAALTSERPFYPADIDEAIGRVPAPRMLVTTPFHLRAWMANAHVARIETLVCATAPLSVGLARQVEGRTGARLFEIYGCTESGQIATRRPTQSVQWEAFPGVRLWNEGEQTMVCGGHVRQPTPLQDVIEIQADGRFLLHGRSADMVNIAGKRNSLAYLNYHLTSIEGVTDGVFFLPDGAEERSVTRLIAFVVAPDLEDEDILAALRDRIDPAFLPRPLLRVEALPREATGKLPREALRALAGKVAKRSPPGER